MFSGEFPEGLASWAGHRAGGVRRLFHAQSGRPSGTLIKTSLLNRLEQWVTDFLEEQASKPRIIILVGGPGNGKTEAIEACIRQIDSSASLDGKLIDTIAEDFRIGTGRPVPRLAQVDVGRLSEGRYDFSVAIVQDASVTDQAFPEESAAELFLGDLERFALVKTGPVYLACVNRGVLDDALTCAIDLNRVEARNLLEHIVRAVSLTSDA